MADSENSTFRTTRVMDNEIVKSDDFNFGFESLVTNVSRFAQMLLDCERNFIIGGYVTVDSGTNIRVAPVFGICASTKNMFGMTEKSDLISIKQDDYHSRVDLLEAKGEWISYDEQQRKFNDLDTDVITYQDVDTKQRLKVSFKVKNGDGDSVVAPATDEGYVKICEIKYDAGTVELTQDKIFNITADVAGMENEQWTNEKTGTYNVNYISSVNERFRAEHNKDGTHKEKIVHAAQLDTGVGSSQVNAAKIPVSSSGILGNGSYTAGESIDAVFVKFAAQFSVFYENYLRYGINSLKGELFISSSVDDEDKLENPIVLGAAGDGTAYCKIGDKTVFTITADRKIRMSDEYIASAQQDLITKATTDAISNKIKKIEDRVADIELTSDQTVYANALLGRYSYVESKIDIATTENVALSGLQVIDGISATAGMLILVKDQTEANENGIYEINSNAWQRHSEFISFSGIKHKMFAISSGSVNKNRCFYCPQELYSGNLGDNALYFVEYQRIMRRQLADSTIQFIFNTIYPIGVTYVQYPQQKSPNELWGSFSQWTTVDYDGAFFRAEGGNAAAFIEKSGDLSKQEQSLLKHDHDFSWSGEHKHGITDPGHLHSYNLGVDDGGSGYDGERTKSYFGSASTHRATTGISVNSATVSISGTTDSVGDDENRPANFTVRIWKRTA